MRYQLQEVLMKGFGQVMYCSPGDGGVVARTSNQLVLVDYLYQLYNLPIDCRVLFGEQIN